MLQVPLTKALKDKITDENNEMAKQALRCIAVAVKDTALGEFESYNGPDV